MSMCCTWDPSPEGSFKLNVDGAIFFKLEKAGVSCLIRDYKGDTIMVASSLELNVTNLESIEALVIL